MTKMARLIKNVQYNQLSMLLNRSMFSFSQCRQLNNAHNNRNEFKTSVEDSINKRLSYTNSLKPILKPKNIPLLIESIQQRNHAVDFTKLHDLYKQFVKLQKKSAQLETKLTSLTNQLKQGKLSKDDSDNLLSIIKDKRKKLKLYSKDARNAYEAFTVNSIRLPNFLNCETPSEDTMIYSHLEQVNLNFSPKSHLEIGLHNHGIEVVGKNPGLFYLKNSLSFLELAYVDYFSNYFAKHNFIMQSNPNIWKAIMIESCAFDHNDQDRVFRVKKDIESHCMYDLYLSGSASPSSFAGYFAQSLLKGDCLPLKLTSIGKRYLPNQNTNLYNSIQKNIVDLFLVCTDQEQMDHIKSISNLFICIYKELDFHFKVTCYSPKQLMNYESYALGFEVYSYFQKKYIEVGRISLCEDFISRRILSRYEDSKTNSNKFTNMIYAQVADVTTLIGLTLENFQHSNMDYDIPNVLKNNFYMDDV